MRNWLILALICVVAIVLLGVWFSRDKTEPESQLKPSVSSLKTTKSVNPQATPRPWRETLTQPTQRQSKPPSSDRRINYRKDGFNEFNDSIAIAASLNQPQPALQDLAAVEKIFHKYQWAFGSVPVGSENREFILPLLGQNPKALIFINHDHPKISTTGELLDRWGTPYFLHPVSSKLIEVRSAGPDEKLWTDDDLTHQNDK